MKLQLFLTLATAVALAAGCTDARSVAGAAADNDQNVLTGGPITGTTIKDLPVAVKETLNQHAPHAEIADIDKITRDGQIAYSFSSATRTHKRKRVVPEDGLLLPHRPASR